MKLLRYSSLVAVMVVLLAGSASGQRFSYWGGEEGDTHTTLAINPDGSCNLTNEAVQPRKALEMQVTTWERYSKMAESPDSEDENAPPVPAAPPQA